MPGFTAAGLGSAGRRTPGVVAKTSGSQKPTVFGPGSWIFTASVAGLYAFRLWGGGGAGYPGGSGSYFPGASAGSYARKTIRMAVGQTVTVSVGQGGFLLPTGSNVVDTAPGNTFARFTNGITTTAGAGKNADRSIGYAGTPAVLAGGVASGGDVNLSGGASGSAGDGAYAGVPGASVPNAPGGGSAPGDEVMTGGNGGDGRTDGYLNNGISPGGAGGSGYHDNGGQNGSRGGDGLAIVTYEGA